MADSYDMYFFYFITPNWSMKPILIQNPLQQNVSLDLL